MDYRGDRVPGIDLNEEDFGTIGSIYENDYLVHIINFKGIEKELFLTLSQDNWGEINKVILEPDKKELKIIKQSGNNFISFKKEEIDNVDTIIRIC